MRFKITAQQIRKETYYIDAKSKNKAEEVAITCAKEYDFMWTGPQKINIISIERTDNKRRKKYGRIINKSTTIK